ncbi:Uncharacterised protein [Escherichia coli]|nr:Uncharacterised protein [Escherichia coli]
MLNKLSQKIKKHINSLTINERKVETLNHIKLYLNEISLFKRKPVNCVL